MATATFVGAAAVFSVDSVDLKDQLQTITMTKNVDRLESTSLADTSRQFVAGLENSSTTFTVLASFASGEAAQSFFGDVGSKVSIVYEPLAGAPGASAPRYTHSNAVLTSLPFVVAVGELFVITATYEGGSIAQAIA
jgi:hypothetical protein